MPVRVPPAILLCCALAPAAWGRQDDGVKKELNSAREGYSAALERVRKGAGDALDAREKAAREKGDKKAVDSVKADRERLKAKGEPPWAMIPAASRAELQKARSELEAAYQRAVREYTKVAKDAEAAEAEKALEEFKRAASAGSPFALKKLPAGPVPEGAVYEGSFRSGKQLKSGGIGKTGQLNDTFTLVVKSVDGESFVGEWTWGKGHVTRVEGTIGKKGQIKFQFTRNLKGTPNVLDGSAVGTIDQKTIRCRYARKSDEKVGVVEGKAKAAEK